MMLKVGKLYRILRRRPFMHGADRALFAVAEPIWIAGSYGEKEWSDKKAAMLDIGSLLVYLGPVKSEEISQETYSSTKEIKKEIWNHYFLLPDGRIGVVHQLRKVWGSGIKVFPILKEVDSSSCGGGQK